MQIHHRIRGGRLRRLTTGAAVAAVVSGTALSGAAGSASAGVQASLGGGLQAAAPVTPAGPVTGTGCTTSGTTAACHLYAVAGSVSLPGQVNPVPVWKFQADGTPPAAGALTGTGPTLVVSSGATVTITLDNVNVPDPVSLAVPGLTGLNGPATGVAAGGTASTYTFTAGRPGTYLYEAGHTANGARQALMGLVGALIVRPSDWTGITGGTSDLGSASTPGSAFQDEAVLVLGDIDPLFAANPINYDLRLFKGTYRTINGKVYPSTDQIPTAVGDAVLLRYLNAGAVNHSMGVLGLPQTVVATDSYPSTGQTLVADMLAAGQTEDVLVTVPRAGNYTVADSGGALDTAGLGDGAGGLAFGGMMTLLGTNVDAGTLDEVGPTSTITSMTPNPAKVTTPVTVNASFRDPAVDGGPNDIVAAELLIDSEVTSLAPGGGAAFTPDPTGPGTATGTTTIPSSVLATLTQGKHRIYVRAEDAASNWGQVTSVVLNLAVTGATTSAVTVAPTPTNGSTDVTVSATGDDSGLGGTVDDARFSVDCDPAGVTPCTFSPMTLGSPGSGTTSESGSIAAADVQALGEGNHPIYVQSHDSEGFWGPSGTATLVVDRTGPNASLLGVNPPTNDGTLGDPADPTQFKVYGTFTDGSVTSPASKIVAAEGFFPLPGGAAPTTANDGTGFVFQASDGAFNTNSETAYGLVPLSTLTSCPDGTYPVFLHAKDAAGNWGPWASANLVVKRGLFADGFESNSLAAWTGGTSPAPPGTRLQVSTTAASAGTYGLIVSGSGTSQGTVQTPAISPAATTYHARFAFNPHSLRTANANSVTGILTGLSGTSSAFQVQYRRGTNAAAAQVRLNFGTANTAWVTIGTTTWSSIQVDWVSGRRVTLTMTVNGAASSLTGRNTSALAITAAQLGFRNATGAVTGTAYFDAFVSSLNPLP